MALNNKRLWKALESISLSEAQDLLNQGAFGEGNMAPKIQAAMNFVKNGGKEVLITDLEGIKNKKGTRIVV